MCLQRGEQFNGGAGPPDGELYLSWSMLKMRVAFAAFTCFYFDGLSDRMRDVVTVACHCGRRTNDCGRLTPPPRRRRRRASCPDRRVTTRRMR